MRVITMKVIAKLFLMVLIGSLTSHEMLTAVIADGMLFTPSSYVAFIVLAILNLLIATVLFEQELPDLFNVIKERKAAYVLNKKYKNNVGYKGYLLLDLIMGQLSLARLEMMLGEYQVGEGYKKLLAEIKEVKSKLRIIKEKYEKDKDGNGLTLYKYTESLEIVQYTLNLAEEKSAFDEIEIFKEINESITYLYDEITEPNNRNDILAKIRGENRILKDLALLENGSEVRHEE